MATTELLSTFQKHIEDMRNLSLCKICIKPFYEPFILSCGHTYCYSCLASWFGGGQNRKSKKSCPDCRTRVRAQPSPNYLLRDLVHMFIGRAELLPEDETVQEHQRAKEEEASLLAADRAGPGLFKGVFLGTGPIPLGQRNWRHGILDPEDNVVRCPDCHWEMEDGECNRCGFHEFDLSESDSNSDDDDPEESIDLLDSEMDSEDELDHEFGASMGHAYRALSRRLGYSSDGEGDEEDEGDDDDEDNDMDGFIDNEADEGNSDSEADTASTMTLYNRQWERNEDYHSPTSSQASAVPHFGYPSDLGRHISPLNSTLDEERSDAGTNYDEMTEESDPDLPTPTQPARRPGATRVILSSDEEDEEEGSETGEGITANQDEDEEAEDDDDDESEQSMTEASQEASASDEESDDSVVPPQSSSQRRQRLNHQRARRGNYNTHQGYHGRANPPFSPPRQQQHLQRQHSHMGRSGANRYQPYQRPFGRRIAVGGGNREYHV